MSRRAAEESGRVPRNGSAAAEAPRSPAAGVLPAQLGEVVRRTWGFDKLRPLQAEAMAAALADRDSLVVLPTGGGKSLCFQAPALVRPGITVVVSPLISLMKDQVDALASNGVPAAALHSGLAADERRQVIADARAGRLRLLYLSPERVVASAAEGLLGQVEVSSFAIDEAHCISDWGHDFRPEYRQLRLLKERFPGRAVHAYTATATPRVQADIVRELGLVDPLVLVGSFDRPNLTYRVARRGDVLGQIREVLDRHPDESGIIYCLRRDDTVGLSESLNQLGYSTAPYHAGLSDEVRHRHQDAFQQDRVRVIVATVAFGMGIDKPNVRFVIHAAAPRSLEGYQQESGRAGRDGLAAECCLFYSPADLQIWQVLNKKLPPDARESARALLAGVESYAAGTVCRHRQLVGYFGQSLPPGPCSACDVCLGEQELVEGALIIGQKVLSCVARLRENYGADYTAQVLVGSRAERIQAAGHDQLSTYGLLGDHPLGTVREWIEQLVGQGHLERWGEYRQLRVTPSGREVLRGQLEPRLSRPVTVERRAASTATRSAGDWAGVDRELFARLREWRREQAQARGVPPFIIFGDATLRELARRRPRRLADLREIPGIGAKKLADYGRALVELLGGPAEAEHVELALDDPPRRARRSRSARDDASAGGAAEASAESSQTLQSRLAREAAAQAFAEGIPLAEAARRIERSVSTTLRYLVDYIASEGAGEPHGWITSDEWQQVRQTVDQVGRERLRPIFEALGGKISYESIRIAVACLSNRGEEG